DTAALMLTVASPKVSDLELGLRARALDKALADARGGGTARSAVVLSFPPPPTPDRGRRVPERSAGSATPAARRAARIVEGAGFIALDAAIDGGENEWRRLVQVFLDQIVHASSFHPDVWAPVVVTDPGSSLALLRSVRGDRYSYRQLDDFTDAIARRLRGVGEVSKVTRAGVLAERIYLDYSQERFAQLGVGAAVFRQALAARNVESPSGVLEAHARNVAVGTTGELESEQDIGDTFVMTSSSGTPVFFRDLFDVSRDYETPPRYLNTLSWRDADASFQTSRAVTLSVQMRT